MIQMSFDVLLGIGYAVSTPGLVA